MSVLPTRYVLLRARLERFSREMPGVETRDIRAVHRTRVASRRLRELLPVLQLDEEAVGKVSHQLRNVTRRLGGVREADVMLLLIAELHESGRFSEPALRLVRDAARAERDEARAEIPVKPTAAAFQRIVLCHEALAIIRRLERYKPRRRIAFADAILRRSVSLIGARSSQRAAGSITSYG